MLETKKVKDLPNGEYVQRVRKDGTAMATVWVKGEYDRGLKKWEFSDTMDMNRTVWIAGDVSVHVGFTY
jgi:hypothetical protein